MNAIVNDPLAFLLAYASPAEYRRGERLFNQHDLPTGCYVLITGSVTTHFFDADIQAEAELQRYGAGDVVGAVGTIDHAPRTISATADDDVYALFLSTEQLERMRAKHIEDYHRFIDLSANSLARKFRELHDDACHLAVARSSSPIVDATVEKANLAQSAFVNWPGEQVDELIQDIAQAVNSQAQSLAEQVVEESGMGVVEHKVLKISLGTTAVAKDLAQHPDAEVAMEAPGIETMVMPMGVVFGMIPVTNPVETIVFKALSAIKARNAIIISSHRKARNVGDRTVSIIREVLAAHGAPEDLVQTPNLPANRKLTQAFMTHDRVHFILATGGPSMVKSAYRSGTPAIGVGKGNAPVWVAADADIQRAAHYAVTSKSFDNGVVCGSENNLLVDAAVADEFVTAAVKEGAAHLSATEQEQLLDTLFENGSLRSDCVGQSAQKLCALAGIERDYPVKLILAEVPAGQLASPLVREKLAPILSLIRLADDDEALFHAKTILNIEGRGHTAIVHTESRERVLAFSKVVEVSRVLVNSPGTQGCIGACNGLQLSWTLGCGTYGGGSTSDNVSFKHLQNQKRIAVAV